MLQWVILFVCLNSLYPEHLALRYVNTLRPRQNGRYFPDDILKWIFLNENVWISIEISLKFVPKGQIKDIPALVQIMAWRRPGDKPLSEPMLVSLLTHICVTRPQWVNEKTIPIMCIPSNLQYKTHVSRQWNCWPLRCSWIMACRRCCNYIFILDLTSALMDWAKTTAGRDETNI